MQWVHFPTQNLLSDQEVPKDINTHFLRVIGVKQPVAYYTLDVIISVGYRVKSQRGVQFRQWANRILKQYLVKGYAVNERIRKEQIGELRQLVGMLGRTIQNQPLLSTDESNAPIITVSSIVKTAQNVWQTTPSLP